eukprot:Protomagalhaensia_sp_Gyna_25__3528@NODE_3171_length_697_cov_83_039514_g2364_i8_p2_GENE_NODE_3171_length_697_cov_83_039514_g2364_i8NODE_3171_length_697_cov_83_039514_g2364_i8_p2_ORF_typecomplete_len111_score0_56DUF3095/PF11294_8/0_078_NODE_3171_length_697_cov_83_039514_g2364_i8317649
MRLRIALRFAVHTVETLRSASGKVDAAKQQKKETHASAAVFGSANRSKYGAGRPTVHGRAMARRLARGFDRHTSGQAQMTMGANNDKMIQSEWSLRIRTPADTASRIYTI